MPFGFPGFSLVALRHGVPAAALACVGVALAASGVALAQTPDSIRAADDRERAFVEGLRREDPAEAERYVVLRDARSQAFEEVQKAQTRYSAAGPELRPAFLQQVKDARRHYAERSLALLDFLDLRERRALARYQEEIGRINRVLEERARSRVELEKLLRGD